MLHARCAMLVDRLTDISPKLDIIPPQIVSIRQVLTRAKAAHNGPVEITRTNWVICSARLPDFVTNPFLIQLVPIKTLQSLHVKFRVISESFETNWDCTLITSD